MWVAELTVCFETSFEEVRERKEVKYSELVSTTERDGYTVPPTLEVGSRGVPHLPGFTALAHKLVISQRDLSSLLHLLLGSHHWLIQILVYKEQIDLMNYFCT